MRQVLLLVCLLAAVALAHPFGELAVDVTYHLTIHEDKVEAEAFLYLPEVSALAQIQRLDADKDGLFSEAEKGAYLPDASRKYESELSFRLNGRVLPVQAVQSELEVRDGPSGELHVLLLHYRFEAPIPAGLLKDEGNVLDFSDPNFTGTPGWKEVMVRGQGFTVTDGPVPPRSQAEALQDRARVVFDRGGYAAPFPDSHRPSPGVGNSSNSMVSSLSGDLTLQTILFALGLAFVLGALHALSPGHGKTVVGAYLIGSRGTIGQAVLLGLVVTITHTSSVILLGLITLFATRYVLPETLLPWIGFVSGLLVAAMGVYLFRLRRREQASVAMPDHHHEHSSYLAPVQVIADGQMLAQPGWKVQAVGDEPALGHSHGGRYHTHHVPDKVTLYSLIALGVSGGMVPCPDALVVLLTAIAINKLALGLLILLAFSGGLASVLIAIGIVLVTAGKLVERYYPGQKLLDRVTLASYCVIVVLGLGIAYQSLASVGLLRAPW